LEINQEQQVLNTTKMGDLESLQTTKNKRRTLPVEGGTFTMGRVQDDVMHDWNNAPNQQHVQSFYMDETEVTNLMYLESFFSSHKP